MVNEEIFGGLKLALSKGESLKQAMMSFYNAGYKKEEIEEAARVLQRQQFQQIQPTQPTPQQPPKQIQPTQPVRQIKPKKKIQEVSSYGKKIKVTKPKITKQKPAGPISSQKISGYGKAQKPTGKLLILFLVFLLLFLLGALAAVFFFKQELTDFINKLF